MKQSSLKLDGLIILRFLASIIAFLGTLCPKNGKNFDEQKNTKAKFQRIIKLKNKITEIKISLDGFTSRAEMIEDRISQLRTDQQN